MPTSSRTTNRILGPAVATGSGSGGNAGDESLSEQPATIRVAMPRRHPIEKRISVWPCMACSRSTGCASLTVSLFSGYSFLPSQQKLYKVMDARQRMGYKLNPAVGHQEQ